MNKIPLRKYVEKLKNDRIKELRQERAEAFKQQCREYAKEFFKDNKEFMYRLIELDPPVIHREDGIELKGNTGSVIASLRILIDAIEKGAKGKTLEEEITSLDQRIIDKLSDEVDIAYHSDNPKAYRDYDAKIQTVKDEFRKLQGNLKTMSGKEGTAYCMEIGIPIPNPEKAKNEVLAPINIDMIKGK